MRKPAHERGTITRMQSVSIDEIIRSKRKTLALIVQRDGRVVVRAPQRLSQSKIMEFVQSKADWILETQTRMRSQPSPLPPKQYVEGETFWYLGQAYPLVFAEHQAEALSLEANFCLRQNARPKASQAFENWYRRRARAILTERVQHYAAKHGFSYQRIRISAARSRWGSCSSRGTLSFPWRLVMAPLPVIDYVVIHELAHTVVPNHSPRFWDLVASILPDWKQKRQWLKKNGQLYRID